MNKENKNRLKVTIIVLIIVFTIVINNIYF